MSDTSAPEAESATHEESAPVNHNNDFSSPPPSSPSTVLSDVPSIYDNDDDPFLDSDLHARNAFDRGGNVRNGYTKDALEEKNTSGGYAPHANGKRSGLEAGLSTPDLLAQKGTKRKRYASPPWQFPTVAESTIKAADGRRVSARFNSSTPVQSESEVNTVQKGQDGSKLKKISPPWKKFAAQGPSSLEVDGKRKSGRVHNEQVKQEMPSRISPRSQKLKVEPEAKPSKTGRPRGRPPKFPKSQDDFQELLTSPVETTPKSKRKVGRPRRIDTLDNDDDDLSSFPTAVTPTRDGRRRPRGSSLKLSREQTAISRSNGVAPKVKLRINFGRHQLLPAHPHAVPAPAPLPPRLNLNQTLEQYELRELQQPHMENDRGPPDASFFAQRNERQAVEEATIRKRLIQSIEPGGVLNKDTSSFYLDEYQPEPPQQYGWLDHVVYQALYFRSLQYKEKVHHRQLAKKIAQEALEYYKIKRGPTEEDIRAEEDKIFRLIYKQVVADMKGKWEMVFNHVQELRKQEWEAIEDAKRQERLQKQLEWSEKQIARQRGELSDSEMEDSTGDLVSDEDVHDASDEESSEEENMSETTSQSGSEEERDEKSAELKGDDLAAYLEFRKADPPDKPDGNRNDQIAADHEINEEDEDPGSDPDSEGNDSRHENMAMLLGDADSDAEDESDGADFEPIASENEDEGSDDDDDDDDNDETNDEFHEAQDIPAIATRASNTLPGDADDESMAENVDLSSDESVEMYDSDEDMSGSEDEDTASDEGDSDDQDPISNSGGNPLLGFLFSSKELHSIGLPTPTTSAGGEDREHASNDTPPSDAPPNGLHRSINQAVVKHAANGTSTPHSDVADAIADHNMAEQDDERSEGDVEEVDREIDDHSMVSKQMVPIPSLLRGTLRSYQHAGLNWLASLYRNGTNGILADEMGLGKTFQTISLLAHLAEEYGVWETHLVIVPTSVILNWVTEFQKFLPGFRVLGYYGSTEERAAKRRCWANDPHHNDRTKRGYNVVVTSYNVAMQDINAIRVVQWHYLVLDEAHNIRNFNSQRWQVLIRLRTKARLLLTGTPLQNSLVELWSLLTFLTAGDDDPAHGDLEDFLSHWKEPVKEIFERGVSALSSEAQKVVDQLHISLRPFLLRRLKSEVEKDLPKKTESVVVCKLSKRQRQLYQEYMGLAATRESLARGNAVSAGRVLLSLRRVCNHPDLFDPRPIQTSFAMEQSPVDRFSQIESLVRLMLGSARETPDFMLPSAHEDRRKYALKRSRQLCGIRQLEKQANELERMSLAQADPSKPEGCHLLHSLHRRNKKLQQLRDAISTTKRALRDTPIYGSDLREVLTLHKPRTYTITRHAKPAAYHFYRGYLPFSARPIQVDHLSDWHLAHDTKLQHDIATVNKYSQDLHETIIQFAFCTPVVTAPILDHVIPRRLQETVRWNYAYPKEADFAHEARLRTSIVFPDKRLLVYDSGKLQRLTLLLRELQARQSRSLIFTQMTGTLNILEQFLSLMNLPYLRLDGSTPVEKRQLYSAEFNRPDSKYQCMILSSRAGGVGLNLVGASSVIFYDLDWNPQMDRQCMDRAHRIGQVRDVEVYKMVSEKTVEENVLRRANQKSLLDQTVIQEGHFTTEYHQTQRAGSADDDVEDEDVAVAIERFLAGTEKASTQALESVEDKEDVQAAQAARREENQDEADFADRSSKGPSKGTTPAPGFDVDDEQRKGHVDFFMIRSMQKALEGVPYVPPPVRRLDKTGRDPSHRPKKRR